MERIWLRVVDDAGLIVLEKEINEALARHAGKITAYEMEALPSVTYGTDQHSYTSTVRYRVVVTASLAP